MKQKNPKFRQEEDSLGKLKVPASALWGSQTQRALNNFPISGQTFPPAFIKNLALIKRCAAETNISLKQLDAAVGKAIMQAAEEVMAGKWQDHFCVDIFQTGSGTSTNMNANEVIANRANEILGGKRGAKIPVHPNDHVNMSQSSNDIIPTCIHITAYCYLQQEMLPVLTNLQQTLADQAKDFDSVVKLARTHLQDATPIRMGQVFGGFAAMISTNIEQITNCLPGLEQLALGGTAVGTGINCHPRFSDLTIKSINRTMGTSFKQTMNHFAAQGSQDTVVRISAGLKSLALSLRKIANDVRWLASGPTGGIGELILPAVQPGSSIMPGKVNPVIVEALLQVTAQVIGNDTAITQAEELGNFELNVGLPVMAHNLFQSIILLKNGMDGFIDRCLKGLKVNEERCQQLLENSLAMVTALVPVIGYDQAAAVAREAQMEGKTLAQVVLDQGLLNSRQLGKILNPHKLTKPSVPGKK